MCVCVCVCVCVCERERERQRERQSVCVHVRIAHLCFWVLDDVSFVQDAVIPRDRPAQKTEQTYVDLVHKHSMYNTRIRHSHPALAPTNLHPQSL